MVIVSFYCYNPHSYDNIVTYLQEYLTSTLIDEIRGFYCGMKTLEELFSYEATNIFFNDMRMDSIITKYKYSIVDDGLPFLKVKSDGKRR